MRHYKAEICSADAHVKRAAEGLSGARKLASNPHAGESAFGARQEVARNPILWRKGLFAIRKKLLKF